MTQNTPVSESHRIYRLTGSCSGEPVSAVLTGGATSVGSEPTNQLVLSDPGVSRRQATLVVDGESVLVVDHGSKNGTRVNGQRVTSAEASPGDELGFGPVRLRLEAVDRGDVDLGVDLAGPRRHPRSEPPAPATTELARSTQQPLTAWLDAARRFAARLADGAPASLAAALAELQGGLGARAVALVEPGSGVVVAASGAVTASALDEILQLRRGRQADERGLTFLSNPHSTGIFGAAGRRSLGLVALGDYPLRNASEALLGLAFELCSRLHSPDPEPRTAASARGLVFPPEHIEGVSPAIRAFYDQLRSLSDSELPVLLVGETGTGKEHAARTLHLSSPRWQQPFVAINCAAIPAELLEAELFGIGERVATGVAARKGKFEAAQRGTLFLDEIGEMPPALQSKLLRVLQEKRIEPLGRPPLDIDARIIAATNSDLFAAIERRTFRSDLYYRIAGAVLTIPPLRERREDVPLLVEAFLRRSSEAIGKPVLGVTVNALEALIRHPWPGNVRQLEHEVQRLLHQSARGGAVDSTVLTAGFEAAGSNDDTETREGPPPADELDLETVERATIVRAMRRTRGNQVAAAKLLGISRHQLRRRLTRYGIDRL